MSGSNLSTTTKYLFTLLFSLFFSSTVLYCQALIGVVDYMSVKNPEEYLKIEETWKQIHKERVKQGMIVGWSVFQVMFKTVEDPYNYVTISWYDSFSKLDKGVPLSIWEETFPNKSEADWKEFNKQTEKTRKLISSGVFHQRLTTSAQGLKLNGIYYVVNELNVAKGKSNEFIALFKDIYLPLYGEDVKNENRVSWSLWEKWPGNMRDFQYLAADGYTSLDQIGPTNFVQYFNKFHPDMDMDEISKKVEEMRHLVNSEMWKLVFSAN